MFIYLRRPAYTTRVLHATLGTYRYICAARHTQLGFITDCRRINVAFIRARDGLIILCIMRMLLEDKRTWYPHLLWARSQQVILAFTSGYNVKALTSYDMGGVATSWGRGMSPGCSYCHIGCTFPLGPIHGDPWSFFWRRGISLSSGCSAAEAIVTSDAPCFSEWVTGSLCYLFGSSLVVAIAI